MPAIDNAPDTVGDNSSPASNVQIIVYSDTTDLPFVSRALKIVGTGTIAFITKGEQTVTMPVRDGDLLPVRVSRVLLTGTTVSQVFSLW